MRTRTMVTNINSNNVSVQISAKSRTTRGTLPADLCTFGNGIPKISGRGEANAITRATAAELTATGSCTMAGRVWAVKDF
jgi:hypothetical protein